MTQRLSAAILPALASARSARHNTRRTCVRRLRSGGFTGLQQTALGLRGCFSAMSVLQTR